MEKSIETGQAKYRKPRRIFEDSGLVNPQVAYYIPLEHVTNTRKQDVKTMIDQGRYFSIFAPRQSGKTTFLEEMCAHLRLDAVYIPIVLSFQHCKKLDKSEFYALVEREFYRQLRERLREVGCQKVGAIHSFLESHRLTSHVALMLLFEELNRIVAAKKIVVFIDEFDGIPVDELENFLTALRELYQKYKKAGQKTLYSVGLIGIRNITRLVVGGVSPFNIADQVELPPFSFKNVLDLYAQYTEETHQPFSEAAVIRVFQETAGQPWLVNRLGTILTVDVKPETVAPIDEHDVDRAIRILLTQRNSHFDNLYEKAKLYKETFVKIVFDNVKYNPDDEDQTWLEQYGLIKRKEQKAVVANNIYKQRYIETFFSEVSTPAEIAPSEYVLPGDRLDMEKVIQDFGHYIAQIGVRAFYQQDKPYEKTGQFLLTAWLYQFVRGGKGDLRYEVLTGLGRMDIILTYGGRKYIIETKVNRQNLQRTLEEGITQVSTRYLAPESAHEGYLVIFDTKTSIGEPRDPQHHQAGNHTITTLTIGIHREST
jgi:hypothetical protein